MKTQDFGLEALGNWKTFKEDDDSDLDWEVLNQTRTHDEVNQVDGISGGSWIVPGYDAAGNMLSGPKPGNETVRQHYKWDAWNRLVAVYADDDGELGDLVATYRYDGLNRRIQKVVEGDPDVTYDYYYSGYQVVEVRKDSDTDPMEQYVWDIRYVHAPVLRWRDENTDGQDIETLYYCNDANFNVTALIATDGTPVERYVYDPYGQRTIWEPDWTDPVDWEDSKKNEILYTGHRLNPESGLHYAGARYYDPVLGLWISWDPTGYADAMNLYAYVSSSPLTRVDPLGLFEGYDPFSGTYTPPSGGYSPDPIIGAIAKAIENAWEWYFGPSGGCERIRWFFERWPEAKNRYGTWDYLFSGTSIGDGGPPGGVDVRVDTIINRPWSSATWDTLGGTVRGSAKGGPTPPGGEAEPSSPPDAAAAAAQAYSTAHPAEKSSRTSERANKTTSRVVKAGGVPLAVAAAQGLLEGAYYHLREARFKGWTYGDTCAGFFMLDENYINRTEQTKTVIKKETRQLPKAEAIEVLQRWCNIDIGGSK